MQTPDQSPTIEAFTETRSLRSRKTQPQTYGFDFSAVEDSDDDPERLALDDAESPAELTRQSSMQPSLDLSFSGVYLLFPLPREELFRPRPPADLSTTPHGGLNSDDIEDDDDASAYAPSQPSSPLSTASDQQTFHLTPRAVTSTSSISRKTAAPQKQAYSEDEEDEDFYARPSKAGPARRKATGKGKKKSENHVKRPPNAFILYRSHACSNNLIPAELKINDHRQISRIVATMWRSLPAEERAVWEGKAKEAKEKHNQEHPEYRYKPSAKPGAAQRKPRPRKPPVADEDLTEEQLRERRRCEIVARVILQKEKESTPASDQIQCPDGGALESSASPEPPAEDIKSRLAREMKKAVEEDRARREFEEEQRRLGLMPPRPTETIIARRQRAATVTPVPSKSLHEGRDRAPSAPPIPSPARTYDIGYDHSLQELQDLLRPHSPRHHRAASWAGEAFEYSVHPFQPEYQAYSSPQYGSYSGVAAQWDIRRPSIIFRDQNELQFPGEEVGYTQKEDEHFDQTTFVDQEGHFHSSLTTQQVDEATDLSVFQGHDPTIEDELYQQANNFTGQVRMDGRRESSSQWFQQTTPTAPNHDWRRAQDLTV